MKVLYEFYFDCGRQGSLEGLFIAEESVVNKVMGKEVYFGEVLGKHSEVFGPLEDKDLTVKSTDQEFIGKLEGLLGRSVSGYNPLDYLGEEDEI